MSVESSEELYAQFGTERREVTQEILEHPSEKKVVVAGPGTGKTHLFKELFGLREGGNHLTLTFINALVEDLSLELHGVSDVKTLHGYALSRFSEGKVKIYPPLPKLVREDGKILLGDDIDFEKRIHDVDNDRGYLDFYSQRRRYYDHFGYSDIILGLVRLFEEKPETIPTYSQIVVDEFQDFNQLEVSLIELLSTKNSMLVAVDDDQAIYDFKSAHPRFIRELYNATREDYEGFTLPYCSRCTKVIIDAVNDIVRSAEDKGLLSGRVPKRYDYFHCEDKDEESRAEPHITHKRLEDNQIAWFITEEMNRIAAQKRKEFEVLIISPYSIQCQKLGKALSSKGFTSVDFKEKEDRGLSYLEGLRLLLGRRVGHQSNLGWRIASGFKLDLNALSLAVNGSIGDNPPPFRSLVPREARQDIEFHLRILSNIRDKQPVSTDELGALLEALSLDEEEIKINYIRDLLFAIRPTPSVYPGIRNLPIKLTTIQSSKGLSSEYVFITHFDQRYLPGSGGVTDQDVCNMLVALTRARKKVCLISTTDQPSEFLNWIEGDRIDGI